jgi:hypothetical protein
LDEYGLVLAKLLARTVKGPNELLMPVALFPMKALLLVLEMAALASTLAAREEAVRAP